MTNLKTTITLAELKNCIDAAEVKFESWCGFQGDIKKDNVGWVFLKTLGRDELKKMGATTKYIDDETIKIKCLRDLFGDPENGDRGIFGALTYDLKGFWADDAEFEKCGKNTYVCEREYVENYTDRGEKLENGYICRNRVVIQLVELVSVRLFEV